MRRLCDRGLTVAAAESGLVHMALARRDGASMHRDERFGAIGRGPVGLAALKVTLEMPERSIAA